jgi:hypothetical protein
MHSVAVLTGSDQSDAGTTCQSDAPIGRYVRVPVEVHKADPRAPEAASCLIALIAAKWYRRPALRSPRCAAFEMPCAPTRSCAVGTPPSSRRSWRAAQSMQYRLYEDDPGRTVAAVP